MHAKTAPISLIDLTPTRGAVQLASGVIIASILLFGAAAPFVGTPLPAISAFIPAYEGALLIVELITALLLLAQYARSGSMRLLILACGYLFNAAIIPLHALSFPGVFSATGAIGSGSQTTAWLYTFWHGCFIVYVLLFAVTSDAGRPQPGRHAMLRNAMLGVGGTLALALLCALLSTMGADLLPVIFENGNYALLVEKGISPAMVLLCLAALFFLWRRAVVTVLDLWVGVALTWWMLDILLSAVLGTARYDLGWYGGRVFGLWAGAFILMVLLWESNSLYRQLADAVALAAERSDALFKSREELARAQRLEAIGQLTGGIAHDFNNVLQVIGASLQLLRLKYSDKPEALLLVNRSLTGVARGARLSTELLAFARRQPMRPKVIDVAALLLGMSEVLQRTLGEAIEVETAVPGTVWTTVTDPALLENAILNLGINARDAMPAGGRLTLSAKNISPRDFDFAQHQIAPGEFVLISVSDNGIGIAPDILSRVFEPFFTTKNSNEGSGLGLSMVYGFAKQSAGHTVIESVVGAGTTVSMLLPRSHAGADAPSARKLAAIDHGAGSILVVEDNPDVRELAVESLESLGYQVTQAHDAKSALELFNGGASFDLLFSDVIMPGPVKTMTMVTRARELCPDMVVLFTSGFIDDVIGHLGVLSSDVHLLPKPYDLTQLSAEIGKLLRKKAA